MAGPAILRLALLTLFCLLTLTGCKDAEKQQAVADAEVAKRTLGEVNTQLGGLRPNWRQPKKKETA